MQIVVVESPAKAKTINKYLGKDFTVLASYGHVRDLASRDGSVKPDADFAMEWESEPRAMARIREIADATKGATRLILATDPDREGEAISWHILEALRNRRVLKDVEIARVAFNAITKDAVLDAMRRPRAIDMELVEAYLARRALDYLVGFSLSPVLWRKLPGAKSAGRVQSVALRLVCEREYEIERFKPEEYWSILADLLTADKKPFSARLFRLDGKNLGKLDLGNEADAKAALARVRAGQYVAHAIESKPTKRNPPPPFTTSTLQQEASRKLGFSASRAMQVAQKLYEGIDIGGETVGLITYMRTDGVSMAEEAIAQSRRAIGTKFGDKYVPETARRYTNKAKNAQEAHEAIRPTDFFREPGKLRLEGDQARLYELVWKRAVASQMRAAEIEKTTVDLQDQTRTIGLRANGQVILFDGFLALYQEGRDDVEDEDGARLPVIRQNEACALSKADAEQHFTQAPPRFSEASLVKRLEELGIGRPSTYASTLQVLRDRDYVTMDRGRFLVSDKGRLVTAFLENFFPRYVEYAFTADVEEQLDRVSAGDLDWKEFLAGFWRDFSAAIQSTGELRIKDVLDALNDSMAAHIFPAREDHGDPRQCQACADGRLSLKTSKFGAFVGCSNYPLCKYTRQLNQEAGDGQAAQDGPLGADPVTGLNVFLKIGRFGPYVQLGEEATPKRSSLPKGWTVAQIDLAAALKLLALPREIGAHPEDGTMILAGLGRFGPYVQHGKAYANLASIDDVFEIGLNRAVAVLADKKAGGGRPQRGSREPLRVVGTHADHPLEMKVMSGQYGAYVTDGKTNATIPKGLDPLTLTLDEALALIKAREGAPKKGKKARASAKPPAKAAAKSGAKTGAKTGAKKPKAASKTAGTAQTVVKSTAPAKAKANAKPKAAIAKNTAKPARKRAAE